MIALAMCLALAGSVRAQHPSGSEAAGPEGSAARPPEVPRVRIDAIVTDRNQLPILDLRAGDFELLENGVARAIESVELRRRPGPSADLSPIQSADDETRAARQPGSRVFALFLDEFHVSPGESTERVRAAVTAFIDQQLQPGDLALVVKPLNGLSTLRFTRDRAALRSTVEAFEGRKGDFTPKTPFEEQYIGRAPTAVALARAQIATNVIRELTLKLGELQADRAVFVVVSEGFPRVTSGRLSRNSDIQGAVRAASRFNVAMYTFNPADSTDVGVPDPSKNDTPAGMLQWLALQTGGRAVLDGRLLDGGFRRMTEDLAAYYVLTYQPERADGGFHPVEVRARRPEALVRTVLGYWSPIGIELRTALTPRPLTPRRTLRRSNLIDIWTGVSREADGRATLTLTWEPRAAFARTAQSVQVKAQTPAGVKLFEGQVAQVGGGGVQPDRATFVAPSGRVELDIAILGIDGKVIDTDARDIDVPSIDTKKRGPVLLTPEIVRVRTVRELTAARTDRHTAPTPDRSFSRTDRLLIRAPTWDASGLDVDVTASVLNRLGQPMRSIDRTTVTGVTAFDLPLSWLAPGDYSIALTAKNANGQAAERILFTVTR